MKKDEDFDVEYQTKSPISESPDPKAPKIPQLPIKKIVTALAMVFVFGFGYNFYAMQKEAIEKYKQTSEPEVETQQTTEAPQGEKIIYNGETNTQKYSRLEQETAFNEIFLGYLATLEFPEGWNNPGKNSGSYPLPFQKAQQDFIKLYRTYDTEEPYKYPSGSEADKREIASEQRIKNGLPLWKFAFEKASNAKDLIIIINSMSQERVDWENLSLEQKLIFDKSEYDPQLRKQACQIIETKIPDLNVGENCTNI